MVINNCTHSNSIGKWSNEIYYIYIGGVLMNEYLALTYLKKLHLELEDTFNTYSQKGLPVSVVSDLQLKMLALDIAMDAINKIITVERDGTLEQ